MRLKVAIVQIDSLLGQPKQNISKIQNLLTSKLSSFSSPNQKNLDLIVLSELAITGYNFKSSTHIKPYLESVDQFGPSLNFGKQLSLKYNCFTIIGYPEIFNKIIYNSSAVFNRKGELIYNYRKSFLYETDEVWGCSENPNKNFEPIILNFETNENNSQDNESSKDSKSIITNIGICMDLNPYKFEAPFNKFEFSSKCYLNKSNLIICPMAWLSSSSPSIKKQEDEINPELKSLSPEQYQNYLTKQAQNITLSNEPNFETINYWILRFFPFLNHPFSILPKWWSNQKKINILICNRIGKESSIIYGGSSCILQFNNSTVTNDSIDMNNPSVDVLNPLSQSEEGIIITEIDV
ncbi:NTA1 [Candida pseudojiufengensis]|uniref:NTA1 n=1 Tax=Candida pseudojiufengensis TaxID=497109 RepID=UPI0022255844|nr:NTA1 [Candida pseudojiufengensis]KAI5964820.1 NTA1 [Candida pseudojiufengensis]